jgi:site-specific DNA-methyltransferase (adenine-specific)
MNKIFINDTYNILPTLDTNSVDLTIFSPPYDNIREYKNNWNFDYKRLGDELFRITKNGGVICCVISDGTKNFAKSLTSFRLCVDWVDRVGFKMFECCIYSKNGRPGNWWTQRFRVDHEYILIFFKGDRPKYFDKSSLMIPSKHAGKRFSGTQRLTNGSLIPKSGITKENKCRGTIWYYNSSSSEHNKTKLLHPATYPDKMCEDLILCFSAPNDIVLDPMCGSGTTCITALKHNRQFIGIEISEEYGDIIKNRFRNETSGFVLSTKIEGGVLSK